MLDTTNHLWLQWKFFLDSQNPKEGKKVHCQFDAREGEILSWSLTLVHELDCHPQNPKENRYS